MIRFVPYATDLARGFIEADGYARPAFFIARRKPRGDDARNDVADAGDSPVLHSTPLVSQVQHDQQ
jgi:hypothetical protein